MSSIKKRSNDFAQIHRDASLHPHVRTTSCTVGTVPVSSLVDHREAHHLRPYIDDIKNITCVAHYIFLSLYLGTRNIFSIS